MISKCLIPFVSSIITSASTVDFGFEGYSFLYFYENMITQLEMLLENTTYMKFDVILDKIEHDVKIVCVIVHYHVIEQVSLSLTFSL